MSLNSTLIIANRFLFLNFKPRLIFVFLGIVRLHTSNLVHGLNVSNTSLMPMHHKLLQTGISSWSRCRFCFHKCIWVPSLFAPGQFASRSESANRTLANSLPGPFAPGPFAPWPIRSLALSLSGQFAPWPFRSLELSRPGAKWPGPFAPGNKSSCYLSLPVSFDP